MEEDKERDHLIGQSFCSMDVPMQLIKHSEGKLELIEETAAHLSNIRLPIIVIGITGFVGSGKSYLMNRLFYQSKGFEIGKEQQACTSGVWVWTRPTSDLGKKGEDSFTILLDSEGLVIGNPQQDVNYDSALFSLVALLSSYFIFNSMGAIDDRSIQQLQLILNLPNCIVSSDDFKKHVPPLLWLLRDFTFENDESSNEYLSNQLAVRRGIDISSQTINFITRRVTGYFQERDCFAISRPLLADKISDLVQLSTDELNPIFNDQMEQLILNIFQNAPIKTIIRNIDGTHRKLYKMNGPAFVALARNYVDKINTTVPFRPKRKDTATRLDIPIYERAMVNLDSQIQLNVQRYDEEQNGKDKDKKTPRKKDPMRESSDRRQKLLDISKDSVSIYVSQENPKNGEEVGKKEKEKEKKDKDKDKDKEKENLKEKDRPCLCDGVGKPITCGFITCLGYAPYIIGALILISIVAVLLGILMSLNK